MRSVLLTTAAFGLAAHAHAQFAYDEAEQDVTAAREACFD